MPRQYSQQFRERVLASLDEGCRVEGDLANELETSVTTIYRRRHQARTNAGESSGTTSREACRCNPADPAVRRGTEGDPAGGLDAQG